MIISCMLSGFLHAQIVVSPAEEIKQADAQGFYYALPRQLVKADLIIQKTRRLKGPYSEFAARMLGTEDYVRQDENQYSIVDVILTTLPEPDPTAWYFVEFDEKGSKDARSLVIELKNNGVILAVEEAPAHRAILNEKLEKTIVNAGNEQHFKYYAERSIYQRIDTILRRITIDTTVIKRNILQSAWVDRNPEQKARAAADFIQEIRDSRFKLLMGYQEVNYGTSIAYMDQQLLKLEQEYLSLFLGVEEHSLSEHSLYFYPESSAKGPHTIGKFSETAGIVNENAKGEDLQLLIESLGNGGSMLAEGKKNGKSKLSNAIYYRIPEMASISLVYKGKVLSNIRANIAQMGSLGVIPVSKTRMQFDPNTGMVTTIKRE